MVTIYVDGIYLKLIVFLNFKATLEQISLTQFNQHES